jgi:murein DD-endopeptidase MepM/ murein hydrolase activator NlpD
MPASLMALLAAGTSALSAQAPTVRWMGDPPVSGGIQWLEVVVPGTPADSVTGQLDGAPVSFSPLGNSWVALAPVRISGGTTARAVIRVHRDGSGPATARQLPVVGRGFRLSRLRVARQFVARPDSALAQRIAREQALTAPLGAIALATPRLFDTAFARPGDGPVAGEFGVVRVFNGAVRSRHQGVDFDGEVGDEVRAANRGVVMLTGDFFYSGGAVYVNHGAGVITAYFHLSVVLVAAGDTVASGQLLGRVGATGRVTGPHLHWLVRVGERPVDGIRLLGLPMPFPPGPGRANQ